VILQSAELAGCWEVSVYLDVSPEETLRRALVRDIDAFGSADVVRERYQRRYPPGQQLYRTPSTRRGSRTSSSGTTTWRPRSS
jgi:uridine kinase